MNIELGKYDTAEQAAYAYNVAAEALNDERNELNHCPNLIQEEKESIFNRVTSLLKERGFI